MSGAWRFGSCRRWLAIGLLGFGLGCGGPGQARGRSTPAPPAPSLLPTPPPPRADGRLPSGVRPLAYRVDLSVDPRERTYFGRVRIDVELERETRTIVLHAQGPRVLTAVVRTAATSDWPVVAQRPSAGSTEADELVLMLSAARRGRVEVDLEFEAPFSDGLRGLYRVRDGGRWYAFTQMQPADARRAIPCFDEPGFKTPFEFTITVPDGDAAFANQPEVSSRVHLDSGLRSYSFSKSPPLPTYLLALATGPLVTLAAGAGQPPMRLIATTEAKAARGADSLQVARAQLRHAEEYFGEPHPYDKLDLVAVPEFGAGAMENPGLMTFREELVLVDSTSASAEARRGQIGIIAHELAHQWLGNVVSPRWWDDLWLNEGLATWMATRLAHDHAPGFGFLEERANGKSVAMGVDVLESARRVREAVPSARSAREAFDTITYVKGASLMHMLEAWLGPDVMQHALRAHVAAHRHGSATSADLGAALDRASGKPASRTLGSFVDQTGVPRVALTVNCSATGAELLLEQAEYRPLGRPERSEKLWAVPVCVRASDGKKRTHRTCVELVERRATVALPFCPALVVPNDAESGYYRAALPRPRLTALFRAARQVLSPIERIGLVANTRALVEAGELTLDELSALLGLLAGETERGVWEEVVRALERMERSAPPAARARLAVTARQLLGPVSKRLGLLPKAGESEASRLMRLTVLRGLVGVGRDPATEQALAEVGARWLTEPGSVPADVARLGLAAHARTLGADGLDGLAARLDAARDDAAVRMVLLAGLTGVRRADLLDRVLSLTLEERLKVQDLRYVFPPLLAGTDTGAAVSRWIVANFDALVRRVPSFVMGRMLAGFGELCDAELVPAHERALRSRLGQVEGGQKALTQAMERAKLCASLSEALAEPPTD